MPEPTTPPVTDTELRRLIAAAAGQTPGVVRLEPTLKSVIRDLSRPIRASGLEGITLIRRADVVEVTVDIAVDPRHTALRVAMDLRHQIADCIRRERLTPGPVNVSVLAIEGGRP